MCPLAQLPDATQAPDSTQEVGAEVSFSIAQLLRAFLPALVAPELETTSSSGGGGGRKLLAVCVTRKVRQCGAFGCTYKSVRTCHS